MERASWTVTIEYRSGEHSLSDIINGSKTTVQKTGKWAAESGLRPVNECITLDLASLLRMLKESDKLVCPADAEGVVQAFEDGFRG